MLRDQPRDFPLNIPNTGQCPDLPMDVVVESVCTADGSGVRGRDRAEAPPALAEQLRRVSASQELTVEAALTGDRERVFEAMLADPLTSRLDWDQLQAMTDELLEATSAWLPQFA
jgi:alpha-galactosidase